METIINKNILKSLELISFVKKRFRTEIEIQEIPTQKINAVFYTRKNNFNISFRDILFTKRPNENKKIEFKLNNLEFICERALFINPKINLNKNTKRYNIGLYEFYSKDFKREDQYFRSINIIEKDVFNFWSFEPEWFSSEFGSHRSLLQLIINNIRIHLMFFKDNEKHYFIIECIDKTNFSTFIEIYNAIMHGYGLITGNFIKNDYYVISSSNSNYTNTESILFRKFKTNIYFNYPIIDSNINHYILNLKNDHTERYEKKLNYLSQETFSFLCENILNKPRLLNSINIILEATYYPLITQTACYCVALETISEIISEKVDTKIILDDLFSELLVSLNKRINMYSKKYELTEIQRDKLLKKLANMNKNSNANKLKYPFEYFKIELKKEDAKAIGMRDKLLHGTFHHLTKKNGEHDLIVSSYRLRYLISKIILKHANYNGYIVNYVKIIYKAFKREKLLKENIQIEKEEFFEKI